MTDEFPSDASPGSWVAAQAHLVAATRQLPRPTGSAEADALFDDLSQFLRRYELEPALALAIALGDRAVAPRSFWLELLAAARAMELGDQALLISAGSTGLVRCRSKPASAARRLSSA
jgi:hypothetical protein